MPPTSSISCNHCGQANDRSATYCAGCNTRLRGFPDDAWIPRALIAANLRTELQLPCMPCRTRDAVDFSASSGNAPEVKATFETGPDVTAPCDLGSLLASFAQLGTDIRARLAFGARMETLSVARAIGFDLQVEMRDPTTSALIASGSWSGKRIPSDGIALALRGERPPGSTVVLAARLRMETAEHGIRELRSESIAREREQPQVAFQEGPFCYVVPARFALQLDPVVCLQPDMSHQLAQTGQVHSANRSSSTALKFQTSLEVREAGTYQLWLSPAVLEAADELAFEASEGVEISSKNGSTIVRSETGRRVRLQGSIVPRLLPSERGTYDADDYSWRFDIALGVRCLGSSSAAPFEVRVASLQLWAARTSSPAVAIDFGTSATSIRVMRKPVDINAVSDAPSAEVISHIEKMLGRPAYGAFRQTAKTALRIEQHSAAGQTPENVTVGAKVFDDGLATSAARSVTLLKRLLLAPKRSIFLSERAADALRTQRVPRIESYGSPLLAAGFLRYAALDLAAEGVIPDICVLSYPASWTAAEYAPVLRNFLELVQSAFQNARVQQRPDLANKPVLVKKFLSEPEALLYYQLATAVQNRALAARIEHSGTLVVIDVGGGTTDVAIVRPKSAPDGRREIFPVLSEAFDLAGEDITHAIASAIWRMLQSEVRALEGTKHDRDEYAALRQLEFPDFSHQRFVQHNEKLSRAVGILHEAYTLAEKFKLGIRMKDEADRLSLGGVRLRSWDPEQLDEAALAVCNAIAERANAAVSDLARRLTSDGVENRPVTVILGGNATKYAPLRDALRKQLEANTHLGGPVSMEVMGDNAKDGVAMGLMLKFVSETVDLDDFLPFVWGSDKRAKPIWTIEITSSDIQLQPISTAPGEPKYIKALRWRGEAGFDHLSLRLVRRLPDGEAAVNISPGTPRNAALWNVRPLDPEHMRQGRLDLLEGDLLQLTFTDRDGRTETRAVDLTKLFEENNP